MKADELVHVRADIQAAIARSGQNDPPLLPQLLNRCLDVIAGFATGEPECVCYPRGWTPDATFAIDCPVDGDGIEWAAELLRDMQIRAVSGIPWGEPVDDEPPHRDEHR